MTPYCGGEAWVSKRVAAVAYSLSRFYFEGLVERGWGRFSKESPGVPG